MAGSIFERLSERLSQLMTDKPHVTGNMEATLPRRSTRTLDDDAEEVGENRTERSPLPG